ncbi:GNAT family N-acetyltransferase [Prauserella sp. ASG 168]|uniref:GNAT family N-acetyltransferase n=2 Tax=Prauserella cavernicola TaxID=2800127 RepID=A0A934QN20_9PSEU|nr:GNAT family N-acetyltransferase [Prauserella cavernicola]
MAMGLADAVESPGGLRVEIGTPERHAEVIALRSDPPTLRRLADEVVTARRISWLTVPTTRPAEALAELRERGLDVLDRPEWLMTTDLHDQSTAVAAPEGYAVRTTRDGAVARAEVRYASGALAARGTIAVRGTDAVAHGIATDAAHRRRGLGRVVMGALTREATRRGASAGLLVSSADGRHLYRSLGWTERASVVIGRTPARR